MRRSYIAAVRALEDHILQVDYVSGSRLLLDMKPYFRPLTRPEIWNRVSTNGIFVQFETVELSHDEILAMAEQD